MSRRTLVLALALSFGSVASGQSQTAAPNYNQLQRILQDKFVPQQQLPQQQPAAQAPVTPDRRDFRWIAPKPAGADDHGEWMPSVRKMLAASVRRAPYRVAANLVDGAAPAEAGADLPKLPPWAQPKPDAGVVVAQQAPVARRNTFVIQLKPNASEQQISDLLRKYDLTVIRVVPGLGLLRVERTEFTSSAEADAPPAQGRQGLEDILNPQIVQDLRLEPIVDSATVDATMSTKSVPKAAVTNVANNNITFSWHWQDNLVVAPGAGDLTASTHPQVMDGNWGLKAIHLPPVWTIIQRYRAAKPTAVRPKLAFVDTGFAYHDDIAFNALRSPNGTSPPNIAVTSTLQATCELAHGNHVAGIAGAVYGNGIGIDGVIPQAKIDAVPFSADFLLQNSDLADVAVNKRLMLFWDVVEDLWNYLQDPSSNGDLRVVNVSLGYNFIADGVFEGDPENIAGLKLNIAEQAKIFANLARLSENSVLFIVAAGNDSATLATPLDTKWSSPMAWAATQIPLESRPKNILIVEAVGRDGQRASFSNTGGHVAAPGVDILSSLWPGATPYGVCSGTSQASPHVAGLATLLFELDPTKKPAEIADIIKSSAIKPDSGLGAPRIDALEAVLKLSPDNLTRLVDLNGDGKVDALDLVIFARQMAAITDNRTKGTPFTEDLNGDGVVDANECSWPLIDFNGSGTASLSTADARALQGTPRTDLQMMELAWTDKKKTFKAALHEAGLDDAIKAANDPTTVASVPGTGCR